MCGCFVQRVSKSKVIFLKPRSEKPINYTYVKVTWKRNKGIAPNKNFTEKLLQRKRPVTEEIISALSKTFSWFDKVII